MLDQYVDQNSIIKSNVAPAHPTAAELRGITTCINSNIFGNYSAIQIMATDNESRFCSFYETFMANVLRHRFYEYKDIAEVGSNGL